MVSATTSIRHRPYWQRPDPEGKQEIKKQRVRKTRKKEGTHNVRRSRLAGEDVRIIQRAQDGRNPLGLEDRGLLCLPDQDGQVEVGPLGLQVGEDGAADEAGAKEKDGGGGH